MSAPQDSSAVISDQKSAFVSSEIMQPPSKEAGSDGLRRRQAQSLEEYLAARQREDRQQGEAGLLPLRQVGGANGGNARSGARDTLMDGARPGMGSAQLHEELGGQLANVSQRGPMLNDGLVIVLRTIR